MKTRYELWKIAGGLIMLVVFSLVLPFYAHAQSDKSLRLEKPPKNAIWLDSLDLKKMAQTAGRLLAGKGVDGSPMMIKSAFFDT